MAIRLATHYLLGPVWPRDRIDIYSRGNRNCTDTTEQLSFSSHSAQRCIPKHPLGCTSQEHVAIICACTQAPGFPLQKASVTSAFQCSLMRACVQITNSNNHFLTTTELVDTMGGHTTSWLGSLPVTIQHQPQLGLLQQTDEPVQACDAQIRPTH